MSTIISEYGRFIVATVSIVFLLGFATFLIENFREYSVTYIQSITGVENTKYVSNTH